jgi:hypothetical protein
LACGADSNIAGGDDVQFARDLPNTIQSRQTGSAVYLGRCNQSTELLYDYGADPNIEGKRYIFYCSWLHCFLVLGGKYALPVNLSIVKLHLNAVDAVHQFGTRGRC